MKVRFPSLAFVVAIPGLFGAVVAGVFMLASLAIPGTPVGGTLTLSEAAALADRADIVRLVGDGADPNARSHIRPGVVGLVDEWLTPLEAAITAPRSGAIPAMVEAGATIDRSNYSVLWCRARMRRNSEALAVLRGYAPNGWQETAC